ncbi:MAG TPA: TolC family protein [Candidatus Acidoferrum sp.]|nr:TolC family protein [Candidatus Acidoferrum sp.]
MSSAETAIKSGKCTAYAFFLAIVLTLAPAPACFAQAVSSTPQTFTLQQAVDYALAHYPAVRASLSQIEAAHAGIGVARTAYLPQLNALYQLDRATLNNIYGQTLPQSVLPSITGPVLPASAANTWGSAAGALFNWQPFDFGYRGANVNVARANEAGASAQANITRLDVAVATMNAYFAVAAAQKVTIAAAANVKRREDFAKSVGVLVENQLRPGADFSRAQADLAQARTHLIQAQTAEKSARAGFAALLGLSAANTEIASGPLLADTPQSALEESPAIHNPFVAAQKTRVDLMQAREKVLDKSYVPSFALQASLWGRGSGAEATGIVDPGGAGLLLQRVNWATGVQVTFPVLQFFTIRAQKRVEVANEAAERARYDQTVQDLTGQVAQARAELEGSREISKNTPIELSAAQDTERQALARYQAGLATIVEVSDAEALLVQAEIDDALARLGVWRSMGGVAAAQGDLQPFLQIVQKAGQ